MEADLRIPQLRIAIASSMISEGSGVPGKIHDMLLTLRELGQDVRLLPLSPIPESWRDRLAPFHETAPPLSSRGFAKLRELRSRVDLISPDVLYYRYDAATAHHLAFANTRRPVVSEHNAIETREFRTEKRRGDAWRDRTTGRLLRRSVSGIAGVTAEILKYQQTLTAGDTPGFVVGNSIRVQDIRMAARDKAGTGEIAFMGRFGPSHGLDRMLRLMRDPRLRDFRLHLIGEGPEVARATDEIDALGAKVIRHGSVFGDQLSELLGRCDLAVSAMGFSRVGLNEACSLKVRRYLAAGLPIILGHEDPAIPPDTPFVLRVANDDTDIDVDAFLSFHAEVCGHPGLSAKIRAFAEEHVGATPAMLCLVKFLAKLKG